MTEPRNPEGFGIYVRNFPSETKQSDLVKYFSQFGNVIWVHFGHDYLLLDFTENGAVEKVMAKRGHFLNGKRLFIRHKRPNMNVTVPINEEEISNKLHQSIIEGLQGLKNFDEELIQLSQKLQSNQSESLNKYTWIYQDLFNILSKQFNQVQVHPFGSTMTGLGFDCISDVDVYLSNVKYTDADEDEVRLLNIIKSRLVFSQKFGNTIVISSSKVPIVKSLHLATKIPCDINIKSMFGVWNSKLIYYYLSLDPRIKPCMIVLKYWAKCHQITKKSLLFSNYSLIMLFIFYLQDIFGFPSVYSLQQFPNLFHIGHWMAGFVPNYEFRCQKLSSNLNLLKGFFEYYAQFDFKKYIIVPYLGQKFPREYFASADFIPESCNTYKTYLSANCVPQLKLSGAICLQDPIEHFRNITSAVNDSTLKKFILLCKLGFRICSEQNQNVLLKLLTEEPKIHTPKCLIQENSLVLQLPNTSLATVYKLLKVALNDILCFSFAKDEAKEFTFNCGAKINMWSSRKATAKKLNFSQDETIIQRELKITQQLREDNKDFQVSEDILSLQLTLEAYKEDYGEGVSILVKKVRCYKKSFKCFALFFTARLPLWLQVFEKTIL